MNVFYLTPNNKICRIASSKENFGVYAAPQTPAEGCAPGCNDNIACTIGSCVSGSCQYTIQTGKCLISSTCYNNNDANPLNECQKYCKCGANVAPSFQPNHYSIDAKMLDLLSQSLSQLIQLGTSYSQKV